MTEEKKPADDKVSVRMRPHARGEKPGQLRRLDKETADRLVANGHARYVGD